jgi:hypothetical protein
MLSYEQHKTDEVEQQKAQSNSIISFANIKTV